jgi:hypothetical protein
LPAEHETQTSPVGLLEELDEPGPLVGILVGSESDLEAMDPALAELRERGISHELKVLSAHRDPRGVAEYASTAQLRGVRVIIAGAGMAAALPGVVAAYSDLPVIGVPLRSSKSRTGSTRFLRSRRCLRASPWPACRSTGRATRRSSRHGSSRRAAGTRRRRP